MKKIILSIITTAILSFGINAQYFQLANSMGGLNNEVGLSITTDATGNVYSTGYYKGTVDFDPGTGIYNLTSVGEHDIYIQKLNASGNFVWAKSIGSGGDDIGWSIAVDASGNVYTTGYFEDTVDFDPGAGTHTIICGGLKDAFVSKLNASGNFVWTKTLSSTKHIKAVSLALDASGNVYTTGYYRGDIINPDTGVVILSTSYTTSATFIQKLNSNGSPLWVKDFNENGGSCIVNSLALDVSGNIYTTGYFNGTIDFNPDTGVFNLNSSSLSADLFISKLNTNGNFVWAKRVGANDKENGGDITVGVSGDIYLTGYFAGTVDFDPGTGVTNLTSDSNSRDIFVSKFHANGSFVWAKSMGGSLSDQGVSIEVDALENVYTTGIFHSSLDLNPGTGTQTHVSRGEYDFFIQKLNSSGTFVWANSFGSNLNDATYSITLDASRNVYSTGYFHGTVDFDPSVGVSNLYSAGGTDIFILKLGLSPVGILENKEKNSLAIYPNPGTSIITLNTIYEIESISILNVAGKTIKTITKNTNTINVSDLAKGVYLLQVITNKGFVNKKFIKK